MELFSIRIQRTFQLVSTILFASQDGKKWYKIGETQARRVGAIRGRYFKYYRIALETALTAKENISGIRLIYDIMPEKRLR